MDRPAAARAIDAFLAAIGRDPSREPELRGTGERVAGAFIDELCSGYAVDVDALVAGNVLRADAAAQGTIAAPAAAQGTIAAPAAAQGTIAAPAAAQGIVMLRDIPVTTTCPHHLMSGIGVATVAFAAQEKLLGVGTIAHLVDAYARRLSLQEHIGESVVAALDKHLGPRWVGCRIELMHSCMLARGERPHGAKLVTMAVRAADDVARAEALRVLEGGEA